MDGYKKYVSFDASREIRAYAREADISHSRLRGPERENVEKALEEIASTPEGEALLQRAAARSPDGKINIVGSKDEDTLSIRPNDIVIGRQDSGFNYFSPRTGQFHDTSIQQVLIHELNHISMGHQDASHSDEADTISMTNQYMRKYYGEPERDEKAIWYKTNDGSKGWDFNTNFNKNGASPESVRTDLMDMSEEEMKNSSPETQSLYEFRNNEKLFEEQYKALKENGGADHVDFDINAHIQAKSPEFLPETYTKPIPVPSLQPAAASPLPCL